MSAWLLDSELSTRYIFVWTPEQLLNYVDHLEIFYLPAVCTVIPLMHGVSHSMHCIKTLIYILPVLHI